MGVGKDGIQMYVTDLGLSTQYRIITTSVDTARQWDVPLCGTLHFAIIHGH